VPGPHIDKEFVRVAGRRACEQLLACGVRVFEYQPTMLHAKSLVVDGVWSSVGSVNFDNRSFQLHDEATLCIQSERFASELTAQFERDLEASDAIEDARWTTARATSARPRPCSVWRGASCSAGATSRRSPPGARRARRAARARAAG
jgi:cardiolipin synthase A/B